MSPETTRATATTWRTCPRCSMLRADHADCRDARLPDDSLPCVPLALLMLLSVPLALGAVMGGLIWCSAIL